MPLFGFRKDKKHEQSHIQAQAGLAKNAAQSDKKAKSGATKQKTSVKPEKISNKVVTQDSGALKSTPALPKGHFSSATDAIIRPRVTEKSGLLSQGNIYTFEVRATSNKHSVLKAIKELYKVTPEKVAMVNSPSKNVFVKGRKGTVAGFKKAYVTLKAGDKIDFV